MTDLLSTENTDAPSRLIEAVDYEAPFVIEKLLEEGVVDTARQGRALFLEAKRYMILCEIDTTKSWLTYSPRVDQAWHQFILFTVEYTEFCNTYFGHYVHHAPCNAPAPVVEEPPEASRAEFAARYRDIFGVDLPNIWDDPAWVTPHRRVTNNIGQLRVDSANGKAVLSGTDGRQLLCVNDIAHEALQFIASTSAFYVRELPGGLTDDQKVRMVSSLVCMGLFKL